MNTTTHNLGQGWLANFNNGPKETLTIRNPDNGQRIDLDAQSVGLLRSIFAKAQKKNHQVSDSVECPHCHWGFSASAIQQHIREKH